MFDNYVDRLRNDQVVIDRHYIWSWHHNLANHGVTEFNHRFNEFAFFMLDYCVLRGGLDDAEKFLLADERPCRKSFATNDHIGQLDQSLRDHAQRIKTRQRMNWQRGHRCATHWVNETIGLGYGFG